MPSGCVAYTRPYLRSADGEELGVVLREGRRDNAGEGTSAKTQRAVTSSLEPHGFASLAMGAPAPVGVPYLRPISPAHWRCSRATSFWRASTGLPGRASWGAGAKVFASTISLAPVKFSMAMSCTASALG